MDDPKEEALLGASLRHAPKGLGRYEVLRQLGAGANGEVYLARDPVLGREVAIKVLRGTGWNQERFLREMRILASLDHEGIVRIHDAGVVGGRPFYVMEHVGQRSLADAGLALHEAVAVVEAVARACHAAHERGVVHRDLKPENIVLGPRPVVIDFGVAKLLDDPGMTRPGGLVGTPCYMAPEQFGDRPVDARTDVYALGVVLFQVTTGRLPFDSDDGENLIALAGRVCEGAPARPSSLDGEFPADLEAIILRAMATEPDARHATALALAEDLRRWLDSLPRAGAATADAPPPARRSGRRRVALGAVVIALAALAGLGLALAVPARQGPVPASPPEGGGDAGGADADPAPRDGAARQPSHGRDSEVARKLAERLAVQPRSAADGTVELVYVFDDDALLADWELTGFDRAEGGVGRRGRPNNDRKGRNLSLRASSGPGVMLHKLTMIDDYEVTVRSHIVRSSTGADLIVLTGEGGASWGTQLVRRGGGGFAAVGARGEADRSTWEGGRSVDVTLTVREGTRIQVSLDGREGEATTELEGKLEGRVGLFMTDMHLIIERITIRGRIDPSKLD